MKVLVIGDGAAEHAIVWKLSQSRHINKIYCCPGNIGIAKIAESIDVSPYNFRTLIDFVKYEWIDLTIVGSRKLFLKGIVNAFEKEGCKILGLHKATAQFMTSRVSVKNLMRQYRIPTPEYKVFTSFLHAQDYIRIKGTPLTIKTDVSLNNGVFKAFTIEDATKALKIIMKDRMFGDAGNRVIVEENLQGENVCFLTVTDGKTITPLTDLYKYKNIGKDKKGLIETVIGAYSPTGIITEELKNVIMTQIMEPLLKAIKSEGIQYKGILIADLICTQKRPYIVDLQCCFLDPETQTILPRLKKDFFEIAFSVIEERLSDIKIEWIQKTSVCVTVFSRVYLQKNQKKLIIQELDKIKSMKDITVFYGGVSLRDTKKVSEGENIFSIIATGNDMKEAQKKAYKAINEIHLDVIYHKNRKDISNKNLM